MTTPPAGARFADRALPAWYDDAKLGVFVHWGPYSVPRWAPRVPDIPSLLKRGGPRAILRDNPYAEWYANTMRIAGSPTQRHHVATYGPHVGYERFAGEFTDAVETADVERVADLAATAGAGYVVLTTKHHDGYTLWPSAHPHPVLGPYGARRDLVAAMDDAVRARGMRMGVYYSGGYDWPYNGAVLRGPADSLLAIPADPAYAAYAESHVRELIERYRPAVLWNDVGWPAATDLPALFAAYYDAVPDGVVTGRWAQPSTPGVLARAFLRGAGALVQAAWRLLPERARELSFRPGGHFDVSTPDHVRPAGTAAKKWEATRGVGHSFAANRNEDPADIVRADALVEMLVDTVSKNGNLLIGIGPLPDGSIPSEQAEPLCGLGVWMHANGSAIRGSRPFTRAEATTTDGTRVRFTRTGDDVNAILLGTPTVRRLVLPGIVAGADTNAMLLSTGQALELTPHEGAIGITLPERLPLSPAHVLRVRGAVHAAAS